MADRFTWEFRRENIADNIRTHGLERFLQWPVSSEALYTRDLISADKRAEVLSKLPQWKAYRRAIMPFQTGYARQSRYDPHLVLQAYHFSQLGLHNIRELKSVYEFGGGFGSMALLLKRLGFKGQYIIQDLPELSQLQRYFLDKEKVYNVTLTDKPVPGHYSLFISNCAVEEAEDDSPVECWNQVSADRYEICYNSYWRNRSVSDFLRDNLMPTVDNISWRTHADAIYPYHSYLIGKP